MSYSDDLRKGSVAENIIENFINESTYYAIKYISHDESGNIT